MTWDLFWIVLYFVPTAIALKKDHPHKIAIILVNILGGFFFGIGWIVALVWCFVEPATQGRSNNEAASELEKLHELKEKGVITEDEFEARKHRVLWD